MGDALLFLAEIPVVRAELAREQPRMPATVADLIFVFCIDASLNYLELL